MDVKLNPMRKHLLYILLLFLSSGTWAQQISDFEDLEATTRKGFFSTYFKGLFSNFTDFGKPFDYTGGIGLNMRSYSAIGAEDRQDPFVYNFNANFNARVYKLNLPFSLNITTRNLEHAYPHPKDLYNSFRNDVTNSIAAQRQRFVRFGVSPRYKWIRTHFGHRSMNFSQYTMSNLVFLGAGAELTPGKLRFAAMYGQLAKAEPVDLSLVTPNIPRFQRKGWGIKAGYGTETDFVEVILFQAKDLQKSIFLPDTLPQMVSPEHNEALGLVFQKTFFEKFRFKADIGASALSPNMNDDRADNKFPHPVFLFQGRQTTLYKKAMEALLDYQAKVYTLGLKYRRVDPGYKTLGAYFFNSDLEEWTLNLSTGLLDGAILLNGNGGIQRNNLDGAKPNRLTRLVGSMDAVFSKGPFSLTANYTNNSANIAYLFDPGDDTLNVIIVTQDAGFSATYIIQDSSKIAHVFSLSGNAQLVTDDVEDPSTSAFSRMHLGNFVYALNNGETGMGFQARLTYNQNRLSALQMKRFGIGFGLTQILLDGKLRAGVDINHFTTKMEGINNTGNLVFGLNLNWNPSSAHTLTMTWNYLDTKTTGAGNAMKFGELIGTLGYQYSFMKKPKEKEEGNK